MKAFKSRDIIGRKIVAVELHRFPTGRKKYPWTFQPEFVLDNGTTLGFVVVETEQSQYGLHPMIMKRNKSHEGH